MSDLLGGTRDPSPGVRASEGRDDPRKDRAGNLLWLDMEMTGLDPEVCVILEVAAIATDPELHPLGVFDEVVRQPDEALAGMDDWNTKTHTASGLVARVPGGKELEGVETDLLGFVDAHFDRKSPIVLCGNSIGQDRKFIDRYMPRLAERLHYRMIDVSSFKEMLGRRFGVEFKKAQRHRALDDIKESIAEMDHYLETFRRGLPPETSNPDR
ncbi:MAG: oligoribonuclease [Actinobacteria bacterium ATB1]|nr:oligoribonuclease [Actinobacteria bacterium ATB1]